MWKDVQSLYTNTMQFYINDLSIHEFWYPQGSRAFPGTNPQRIPRTSIGQCNWSSWRLWISSTDSSSWRVSKFVDIVSTIQMVFITQPQKIKLHVPSCSESTNYSQWDKSGPRPLLDGLQVNDGVYIFNGWGEVNGGTYFIPCEDCMKFTFPCP